MVVRLVLELVSIIRRRSVVGVKMCKCYSLGSTALHKVRFTDFVFLPRLWEVMKRKRVSNVFITSEKGKRKENSYQQFSSLPSNWNWPITG